MGGDHINYPDDCDAPTADLLTVKILLNSVISTPKAKSITLDIKYFEHPIKAIQNISGSK